MSLSAEPLGRGGVGVLEDLSIDSRLRDDGMTWRVCASAFMAFDLLAPSVAFIVFLLTGVASTSELIGDVDSVRKRFSLLLSR
jgi:hypothetical protein